MINYAHIRMDLDNTLRKNVGQKVIVETLRLQRSSDFITALIDPLRASLNHSFRDLVLLHNNNFVVPVEPTRIPSWVF